MAETKHNVEIEFMVPFYRNVHYLKKTLNSVLAQSKSNWRVTVFDDRGGETELARKVVEDLNDDRFTFRETDQSLGIAGNWNRCIENARARYMTILHADDELHPDYSSKVPAFLDRNADAVIGFCGSSVIDADSKPRFSFPDWIKRFFIPRSDDLGQILVTGETGLKSILRGNYIFCPCVCYRTSIIQKYRFESKFAMVLDLDLYSRLLFDGQKFAGFRETLFFYRRHDSNATVEHTKTSRRFLEEIALFKHIQQKALQRNWNDAAKTAGAYWIVKLNIIFCFLADVASGKFSLGLKKLPLLVGKSS